MRKLSYIFCLCVSFAVCHAQENPNLYNEENTRKFAEYLLESGQSSFAIKEFERLNFLKPNDEKATLNLLKAYRLSGLFEGGIERAYQLFPDLSTMPRPHSIEFSKLLLSQRDWPQAENFWLNSESLSQPDKVLLNSTVHIFNSDFIKAQNQLSFLKDSTNYLGAGYLSIVDRALHENKKSPFLAGALSVVIPGLGKAYTGNWKDGVVSLIFTGGMAFQAIRKFNQYGSNNYRPWVYTLIGSGFYLGNIYGSVKSAKNKNIKRINILQHEASDLFNSYY